MPASPNWPTPTGAKPSSPGAIRVAAAAPSASWRPSSFFGRSRRDERDVRDPVRPARRGGPHHAPPAAGAPCQQARTGQRRPAPSHRRLGPSAWRPQRLRRRGDPLLSLGDHGVTNATSEILFDRRGAAGPITLHRPQALHASKPELANADRRQAIVAWGHPRGGRSAFGVVATLFFLWAITA